MKFIKINANKLMDELNIPKNSTYKNYLKYLKKNFINDDYVEIFKWIYKDLKYVCIGIYDNNNSKYLKNDHTLPSHGISHFMEQKSEKTTLYDNIYILSFCNEKVSDFTISDYSLLFHLMDEIYDNSDNDSDEECKSIYSDNVSDLDDFIDDENHISSIKKDGNILGKNKKVKKELIEQEELDLDLTEYL